MSRIKRMRLMMRGAVCSAAWVAIALSPWGTPARTLAADHFIEHAQSAPAAPEARGERATPPANSPEQIKRAQAELERLDCLKGRIDGYLGPRTRKAVKDYWAMAKQHPAAQVAITDALIAELAERGDNYCRPARPFFSFGGRGGGGNLVLPFTPGGARPGPLPGTAPKPPAAEAEH